MINVLSCFDGISCGQVALERAGIEYENYYASEIDKSAIEVTQHNYPKTIQLGDVEDWESWNLENVDLIMGGSPCQGFSVVGKRLNFDDPRSKLFFTFADILKHYKPKHWLYENVIMDDDIRDAISEILGTQPVMIESADVSAQLRKRYYWSNIPFSSPRKLTVNIEDILEHGDYKYPASIIGRRLDEQGYRKDHDESIPRVQCLSVRKGKKAGCLTTVTKDSVVSKLPHGNYTDAYNTHKNSWRHWTPLERERLQTLPDGYTEIMGKYNREKGIGNGWTVDVIVHIFNSIDGGNTVWL